jgi:SET domain-containing protein
MSLLLCYSHPLFPGKKGVFAHARTRRPVFTSGDFITEYAGITKDKKMAYTRQQLQEQDHFFEFGVSRTRVLYTPAALRRVYAQNGSAQIGCFVNHSTLNCNSEIRPMMIGNQIKLFIHATKDIWSGDEILINYGSDAGLRTNVNYSRDYIQ